MTHDLESAIKALQASQLLAADLRDMTTSENPRAVDVAQRALRKVCQVIDSLHLAINGDTDENPADDKHVVIWFDLDNQAIYITPEQAEFARKGGNTVIRMEGFKP